MRGRRIVAMMLAVVALHAGWAGAAERAGDERVQARLVADRAAVAPGETFRLGVLLEIKPEWHVYWINPGATGLPTEIEWSAPDGWEVGPTRWPIPDRFTQPGDLVGYGYSDQVLLSAAVTVPESAEVGRTVTLAAQVDWLCCKVQCIPGEARLSVELPVRSTGSPGDEELFEEWRRRLPADPESEGSPLVGVEGAETAGTERREVTLRWKEAVSAVDLYPATGDGLELTDIEVDHAGEATTVRFTPEIFIESEIAGGTTRVLIVYEGNNGRRGGVWLPIRVLPAR